jgi:uncharacterized protein YbjT (DUF2867 family)
MAIKPLILVTGATGYVGGRLVPRLLDAGYRVRVLVRGSPNRLVGRPWASRIQVVVGDLLQPDTLSPAMLEGVSAAYYLIHSMATTATFAERDVEAATAFGQLAAAAGVQRIIYLGGLGDPASSLSEHLRSRQDTGTALRASGVPVTEFRAGMVVGSGSLSFEMLRALCERLPVMLAPLWVFTRTQPIAIRDVLSYLIASLNQPESAGKIIEIGGADVLTYGAMIMTYARTRGLARWIIPVPVPVLRLSAQWIDWITPVPKIIAWPLLQGLFNEMVVRDHQAWQLFPEIQPIDFATAVRLALRRIELGYIETIWSDALASSKGDIPPVYLTEEQGVQIEHRERVVEASPATVYRVFTGIGGTRGWPAFDPLWRIRGLIDRLIGGVGMRRGRRHPDELRVGDALDFWRVETVVPDRTIILRAEMKLPGYGWLQFEARPEADGRTRLIQVAYFASKGLFGVLYWYGLYPLHGLIFSRLIAALAAQAEAAQAAIAPAASGAS